MEKGGLESGAGLCMLRRVSEQAGATRRATRVVVETSTYHRYLSYPRRIMAFGRAELMLLLACLSIRPDSTTPAHDYVLNASLT